MTDTLFAFRPADEALDEDAGPAPSRARVVVLGGVALVAAVAGAAFWLTGGGADGSAEALVAPVAQAAPAVAAPEPTAAVGSQVPEEFTDQLARDPFAARYVPPAAADPAAPVLGSGELPAPTGSDPAAVPALPAVGPVAGPAVPSYDGGAAGPQPAPVGEPGAAAREQVLVLTGVEGTGRDARAVLTLDGEESSVALGDTFGPQGHLLLLSLHEGPEPGRWTAVVQVGDGDPFDVVTGEPARVR